jgi:hypothetical protein
VVWATRFHPDLAKMEVGKYGSQDGCDLFAGFAEAGQAMLWMPLVLYPDFEDVLTGGVPRVEYQAECC